MHSTFGNVKGLVWGEAEPLQVGARAENIMSRGKVETYQSSFDDLVDSLTATECQDIERSVLPSDIERQADCIYMVLSKF